MNKPVILLMIMAAASGCSLNKTNIRTESPTTIKLDDAQLDKLKNDGSIDYFDFASTILSIIAIAIALRTRSKDLKKSTLDDFWFRTVLIPPAIDALMSLTTSFRSADFINFDQAKFDAIAEKIEQTRLAFDAFTCLQQKGASINIEVSDLLDDLEQELDDVLAGNSSISKDRIVFYKNKILQILLSHHQLMNTVL